jgi:hypothetical protein
MIIYNTKEDFHSNMFNWLLGKISQLWIRSKSLWRWYINTIIEFLDIIHHPVFLFKTQCFRDWILSPSSGKSLLSLAQSSELVLDPEIGTTPIDWAQLGRLLPEDGDRIQSSKHCVWNEKVDYGKCPKTQYLCSHL